MINERILYQEEQGYVGLYYDSSLGHIMTVVLSSWSAEEYKRYLVIWGQILNQLKSEGLTEVYALPVTSQNKKFDMVFGFVPTNYQVDLDDGTTREILRLQL